jgi:hypothetical protein
MSEVATEADKASVAHLTTSLAVTVVFYAAATRGSLVVARSLAFITRRR